jgi:TolA-binding protein
VIEEPMRSASLLLLSAALAWAASGCSLQPTPQSVREYEEAERLFQRRRYEQAAVGFRGWLGDYRDASDVLRPWVMYRLGECYRMTGRADAAAAVYRRLIQLHEQSKESAVRELLDLTRLRLRDVAASTGLTTLPAGAR